MVLGLGGFLDEAMEAAHLIDGYSVCIHQVGIEAGTIDGHESSYGLLLANKQRTSPWMSVWNT